MSELNHEVATQGSRFRGVLLDVPGAVVCILIALLAEAVAGPLHLPPLAVSLCIGLILGSAIRKRHSLQSGVALSGRVFLRVGIALLGFRFTFAQIQALGWAPIVVSLGVICVAFAVTVWLSKRVGLMPDVALILAGAVGICGASAALAIASTLPKREDNDTGAASIVVMVSFISLGAMFLYPALAHLMGLGGTTAGVFLGGAIHDVAGVVGAAYAISQHTGEVATVVKLTRVALLAPVVMLVARHHRESTSALSAGASNFPVFVLGFIAIVVVNNADVLPAVVPKIGDIGSQMLMAAAIAALGIKTKIKEVFKFKAALAKVALTSTVGVLLFALFSSIALSANGA